MLKYLRMGNKRTKVIWWSLIIITVATFLGGFVFLLGSGLGSGFQAAAGGALGTVNGKQIGRTEFLNSLEEQRASYRREYGSDPVERDLRMLEVQTWRSLVLQHLMLEKAKELGLDATDREVVLGLQMSPPAALANAPVFQTNGQFDYQKYQAALRDPNNNWSQFEDMMREQIPIRKLQERLLVSLKVSEGEIAEAFHDRFDRVDATIAMLPWVSTAQGEIPDAELERVYQANKSRFMSGARTELEVLQVPKKFTDAETKAARDQAESLVRRARAGEDFAQLASDYSEGPGADEGGVVKRSFRPDEFEGEIASHIVPLQINQIADAFQDQTRFVIVKRMPPDSATAPGNIRIAQIVVRIRADAELAAQQLEDLKKTVARARREGLGRAAAAAGLATFNTGPFETGSVPPALYAAPEAAEWAVNAKQNEVSTVFISDDQFVIAQVTRQRAAGVAPRTEVTAQVRQLAALDRGVGLAKGRADTLARMLAAGTPIEQAAPTVGATLFTVAGTSRDAPDQRISGAPELIGALFRTPAGKTVGPVRAVNGWYFARVDRSAPADTSMLVGLKGQIVSEILERRQRSFLSAFLTDLRSDAKVKDLRGQYTNAN